MRGLSVGEVNDWESELIYRYLRLRVKCSQVQVDYEALVTFSNPVTEDQIPKIDRLYLQRTLAVTT